MAEMDVVQEFSRKLNLVNRTDGSIFIYTGEKGMAKKPDGYYYADGVTFILDAKDYGVKFVGQLEDYMKLEKNRNYVGFKYNGKIFECYINGKRMENEREPQEYAYYLNSYFKEKESNEEMVSQSAEKLACLFREAGIDKQTNVPFIGAVLLYMSKMGKDNELNDETTSSVLRSIKEGLNKIFSANSNINKKQKTEYLKKILDDSTLKVAKIEHLRRILTELSTVYNFINVSHTDLIGYDIMNNFLKVFRRWNSADAKEKGEVFTPDHIATLMYHLADCSRENTILDPACGSGTFLIAAMREMFNETKEEEYDIIKDIKENRLFGIENNEFN